MRTTFLDPELDAHLDQWGYVVVPLLNAEEVERLQATYERLGVAPGDPQRACVDTFHCFDAEYKEAVHSEVENVIGPAVQRIFDRYKSLSYCYIQKWPGERSAFGLHQDISVVEEKDYRSVEVWCALTDTSEENGQLWVTPGSHKWAPEVVRGIHSHPPVYAGLEERILSRHSIPVPMKAGEAVIFCHSTYHFSYRNESGKFRLVAATDMIPEEALHVHYVGNDRGTIDEFEIDESFWVEQNPFTMLRAPAKLKKIGERDPATFRQLTDEDLDRFVAEGMAIEHEPVHYEQFNDPDTAFCHRCGTTDGVEGHVNRWSGNITLLCPNCEAAQARMAGVIGDIDPAVLEALDRDGFVVVDLFDDAARAEARTIIDTLGIATDNPFYVMNRDASRDDAVRVDQALQQLVQPSIDRALNGYRVFKSIPIVKGNVGDNPVNLHQDWEYVDERYHRGYGVWCPLDGASEAQGGIFVVPGSHKWMDNHRGSGFEDPYRNVLDLIIERGSVFVPLAPGQAVVYDNQLLHHTSPNTSDAPRVVVASVICPPDAAVIHMHSTDGGATAEVFEIPAGDTYFTAKEFGSRPDGIPTRTVDVAVPTVTEADVLAWIPEPIVREVTAVTASNGHDDHEKIAPPPATADGSGTTEPILLDRPVSALPLKSGLGERVKQLLGR